MPYIQRTAKRVTSKFLAFLRARISIRIQIVFPESTYHPIMTPRVIEVIDTEPISVPKCKLRFSQRVSVDVNGVESISYFTEKLEGKYWEIDCKSISMDKTRAMDLHLRLLELGTLADKTTTTVLWEGLGVNEAKSWVELHK